MVDHQKWMVRLTYKLSAYSVMTQLRHLRELNLQAFSSVFLSQQALNLYKITPLVYRVALALRRLNPCATSTMHVYHYEHMLNMKRR